MKSYKLVTGFTSWVLGIYHQLILFHLRKKSLSWFDSQVHPIPAPDWKLHFWDTQMDHVYLRPPGSHHPNLLTKSTLSGDISRRILLSLFKMEPSLLLVIYCAALAQLFIAIQCVILRTCWRRGQWVPLGFPQSQPWCCNHCLWIRPKAGLLCVEDVGWGVVCARVLVHLSWHIELTHSKASWKEELALGIEIYS